MNEAKNRCFYDIHTHAMNLSHPNLLSFLKRMNISLILLIVPILAPIIRIFGKGKVKKAINLLSMMENDLGSFFLLLEYYLKAPGADNVVSADNTLIINNTTYNKIILTPLMMDFGYKIIKDWSVKEYEIFYNMPPQKPIMEQVIDMFRGIKKYTENELILKDNRLVYKDTKAEPVKKDNKLFEIYPFLGINTKNYDLDKINKMLQKYFGGYTGTRQALYEKMGVFNGDIEAMGSNFFAGIKVYPPLGFDPWPEDKEQREKVEALYEFCCDKRIPLTAHCSDGGFIADDHALEYTSPYKWEKVLSQDKYRDLKLNLAHFGKQDKWFTKKEWVKKVMELVFENKNVYTDFSCCAFDDDYYESLKELIGNQPDANKDKLIKRILFGSDMMINLLWTESYNKYLQLFSQTGHFSEEKDSFCSINPERFLFRQ